MKFLEIIIVVLLALIIYAKFFWAASKQKSRKDVFQHILLVIFGLLTLILVIKLFMFN